MALTIGIYDRFSVPHDEGAIFVWAGTDSLAHYGDSSAYKNRESGHSQLVDDWDWFDATKAAEALADRIGAQIVYVVRP